ncbi:hypothetical protein BC332_33221 [Capsicum chinense]|nr:hypothetical protein BC332_33221 [Capsicum chinense]
MAFWCRMKNSKIKTLSIHLKRCYFQCNVSNSLIANASQPSIRVGGNSILIIPKSPFGLSQSVRCFAAPVQAKTKKEEKESSGPRLNREITADVVRLVSEEGRSFTKQDAKFVIVLCCSTVYSVLNGTQGCGLVVNKWGRDENMRSRVKSQQRQKL